MPTKRISHEKAIRKNIIECSVWWFHIWISDKQVPVSVRIRRRLWVIARVRERAEHSQYRKTIIWITSKQSARCRIKYPLRRVISPIDLSACWRLDILRSWYEAPLSKWSAMMFISFVFVFFFHMRLLLLLLQITTDWHSGPQHVCKAMELYYPKNNQHESWLSVSRLSFIRCRQAKFEKKKEQFGINW